MKKHRFNLPWTSRLLIFYFLQVNGSDAAAKKAAEANGSKYSRYLFLSYIPSYKRLNCVSVSYQTYQMSFGMAYL